MSQVYKCDVCRTEVNDNTRKVIMLKGHNDLCGDCAHDIMNYIDLMKVTPTVRERINILHEQLFKDS